MLCISCFNNIWDKIAIFEVERPGADEPSGVEIATRQSAITTSEVCLTGSLSVAIVTRQSMIATSESCMIGYSGVEIMTQQSVIAIPEVYL